MVIIVVVVVIIIISTDHSNIYVVAVVAYRFQIRYPLLPTYCTSATRVEVKCALFQDYLTTFHQPLTFA
jgi:hypothetical protein